MRLVALPAEGSIPMWPVRALQTLARYMHHSKNVFMVHHFTPSLLKRDDCIPGHVTFGRDPQLPAGVLTKHGVFEFLQVIGLVEEEFQLGQQWSFGGMLGLLKTARHHTV